jgi:hypothetical protein
MFIPLKMVLIGIDPYPNRDVHRFQQKCGISSGHRFTGYTQKKRIELGFSPEKQGNHVMIGKRYRMNKKRTFTREEGLK